ncbi:putative BT1 family [Leishmania shawi]|uniref:BT1 family n=1 Tax=Leishmania shawi TaxID=5680 RepID=A0AAW3C2R7_9TRYP
MGWTILLFGFSCEGEGHTCTVASSLCYFLDEGFSRSLINTSRYAILTDRLGIDDTLYQHLQGVACTLFSKNVLVAAFSDFIATLRSMQHWARRASGIVGGDITIGFGLLHLRQFSSTTAAVFILVANLLIANVDILSKGHYRRLLRRHPRWCARLGTLFSLAIANHSVHTRYTVGHEAPAERCAHLGR